MHSPAPRPARSAPAASARRHGRPNRNCPSSPGSPGRWLRRARSRGSPAGWRRRHARSTPTAAFSAGQIASHERHVAGAPRDTRRPARGTTAWCRRRRSTPERQLAQRRHLALARLVHDLAGRGVHEGRLFLAWCCGEEGQHAACELRIQPQRLQRGDHRVAPEGRGEPRNARVRIRAGVQFAGQQREVGARAFHPALNNGAFAAHARAAAAGVDACACAPRRRGAVACARRRRRRRRRRLRGRTPVARARSTVNSSARRPSSIRRGACENTIEERAGLPSSPRNGTSGRPRADAAAAARRARRDGCRALRTCRGSRRRNRTQQAQAYGLAAVVRQRHAFEQPVRRTGNACA